MRDRWLGVQLYTDLLHGRARAMEPSFRAVQTFLTGSFDRNWWSGTPLSAISFVSLYLRVRTSETLCGPLGKSGAVHEET